MRAVVQRVLRATIVIDDAVVASIGHGLAVLVGFCKDDESHDLEYIARKLRTLRVFSDEEGKMNRALAEAKGELLVVPQFTLYGDARKGCRPSYSDAMEPETAKRKFDEFVGLCSAEGLSVQHGIFGAHMQFELVNDGPVTILLDSKPCFSGITPVRI